MPNTKTNREIVQEGLDARAEARAEETQEDQEAKFLKFLNDMSDKNWKEDEQRREEADATRRNTFMQRLFVTVAIIAAVILLYTIQAVAFWLTLTIGIAGLIYIIAISVGYWRKPRRKE